MMTKNRIQNEIKTHFFRSECPDTSARQIKERIDLDKKEVKPYHLNHAFEAIAEVLTTHDYLSPRTVDSV